MAIGPCLVHEVWHWSHITRVILLALAAEAERARAAQDDAGRDAGKDGLGLHDHSPGSRTSRPATALSTQSASVPKATSRPVLGFM